MTVSLVVIAIGLGAVALRGKGMFNIDFTGGTLVTIRLNEQDPAVEKLSPSARTGFVREKTRALPDVTVESLSVAGANGGSRYNIRTTEQKIDNVKQAVLDSFGTALQRVSLSVGDPTPIAAAPPESAEKKDESAIVDRFAGGRQYPLKFNLPQSSGLIANSFRNVLAAAKVDNPDSRFEVVNPKATTGATAVPDSETLELRTNLEPEVAQAQLAALTTSLQSDRSLLFERSETFGSTVAGETQTLAIVATVASWLIIAVYLWLRFKSLVYGLAAIIAVVHDVLVTLGAVAITYWLSKIPGDQRGAPARAVQDRPADDRGVPDADRLLGQRHDRHLRPGSGRLKGKTPNLTGQMINDGRQPDVEPDDPDLADRVARRGRPLPPRRRGAARVRLLARRRVPERHLQHDLHRQPDPDRLGPLGRPGVGPQAGAGRGPLTRPVGLHRSSLGAGRPIRRAAGSFA